MKSSFLDIWTGIWLRGWASGCWPHITYIWRRKRYLFLSLEIFFVTVTSARSTWLSWGKSFAHVHEMSMFLGRDSRERKVRQCAWESHSSANGSFRTYFKVGKMTMETHFVRLGPSLYVNALFYNCFQGWRSGSLSIHQLFELWKHPGRYKKHP